MGTFSSTMRWTPFEVRALEPSSRRGDRRRDPQGEFRKGHYSTSQLNVMKKDMKSNDKSKQQRRRQRSLSQSQHAYPVEKELSQSLIMGASAPLLYEQALVGQWDELIARSKTHPAEAMYSDRCRNTALHLACRRQPSAEVVTALLRADPMASQRTTIDGLTALHFAAYCGANTEVVDILLQEGQQLQLQPQQQLLTDHRGRTPLHCACAGFRTSHRPEVVRLLLQAHSGSATMADERNRTPFTLMMEDYAEEVEEALSPATSPQHIWQHRIVPATGDLHECWQILSLLLHAAHLGTVPEQQHSKGHDAAFTLVAQFYHSMDKVNVSLNASADPAADTDTNPPFHNQNHAASPMIAKVTSNSLLHHHHHHHHPTSTSRVSARHDEIDLNNVPFRPVHAIAACAGSDETFPPGFVKLVLKLYAPLGGAKEEDEELNLPLHIAARATHKYHYPTNNNNNNNNDYNHYSSNSSISGWNHFSLIRNNHHHAAAAATVATNSMNNSRQNLSSSHVYNADFGQNRIYSYHHFNKDHRHNDADNNNNNNNNNEGKSNYNPTSTTVIVTMKKEQSQLTRNTIIEDLINLCPQAASIRDETGKYPLILAIETGKAWDHAVEPIFRAFPEAFTSRGSTIQSTFMKALTNPLQEVRDETARTLGQLFQNWPVSQSDLSTAASSMEDMKLNDIDMDDNHDDNDNSPTSPSFSGDDDSSNIMSPYHQFDDKLERPDADHFITSLLEMVVSNMNFSNSGSSEVFSYYDISDDDVSEEQNRKNDQQNNFQVQIQVSMLQALYSALSNVPKEAIKIPETPEKALNSCIELLKYHPDESVRDGAARVIGSAVTLIGESITLRILHSLIPIDNDHDHDHNKEPKEEKPTRSKLLIKKQRNKSCGTSGDGSISSLDVSIEEIEETEDMNIILHGKAAACYRILSSPVCDSIVAMEDEKQYFCGLTSILKDWMVDADQVMVRKAASLALGPILGYGLTQLKEVKHTILKCMRATEDAEVHIFLARGLMVAARKRPKLFICKHGTPILDGALMLAMSAPIAVQKMFHGFLWIALGIDKREDVLLSQPQSSSSSSQDSNNKNTIIHGDYVSEYMTLAEGENGRIMMSLVTKTLTKISSVKDVW